jgi:hypothetical protein
MLVIEGLGDYDRSGEKIAVYPSRGASDRLRVRDNSDRRPDREIDIETKVS